MKSLEPKAISLAPLFPSVSHMVQCVIPQIHYLEKRTLLYIRLKTLGVLTSLLGFGEQDCALMIALYIAMDSFGTACNVTGDGAISLIVDRVHQRGQHQQPCPEDPSEGR